MSSPDVTVCVIDYNYGRYLRGAISSALAQDQPVEVVVVDDGSSDDSRAVAAEFGDAIVYLWKPNGGLSDARNFALARCRTEFILFLDADDRLPPDFVSKARRALDEDPSAGFAYVQLASFANEEDLNHPDPHLTTFPSYSRERLKRGNYINAAALLRRSALDGVRYDARLRFGLEDWEFFISLAERGTYGVLVEGTALWHRQHVNSMGEKLQRTGGGRRLTYMYIIAKHCRFFGLDGARGFVQRSARFRLSSWHPRKSTRR